MFVVSVCMCTCGCACTCGLFSLAGSSQGVGPGGLSDGLDWHKGSMERVADCWEMPASLSPVWNKS